jgi:hypothetical protein
VSVCLVICSFDGIFVGGKYVDGGSEYEIGDQEERACEDGDHETQECAEQESETEHGVEGIVGCHKKERGRVSLSSWVSVVCFTDNLEVHGRSILAP